MNDLNFKVKVSSDLCHRSGYIQNASVKNLHFSGSTFRVIPLSLGGYSLTVFVGAGFSRTNVDYSVELLPSSAIQLQMPKNNLIYAKTIGSTGFVVTDFTLS